MISTVNAIKRALELAWMASRKLGKAVVGEWLALQCLLGNHQWVMCQEWTEDVDMSACCDGTAIKRTLSFSGFQCSRCSEKMTTSEFNRRYFS